MVKSLEESYEKGEREHYSFHLNEWLIGSAQVFYKYATM